MSKRAYTRRTDEERITELQGKIGAIRDRIEVRKRRDSPVLKEGQKVLRQLRKFMQLATDHERVDISNSAEGFAAGLERMLQSAPNDNASPRRGRRRAGSDD